MMAGVSVRSNTLNHPLSSLRSSSAARKSARKLSHILAEPLNLDYVRQTRRPTVLVGKAVPHDAPQCLHTVFPGDLLALFVRTPGVGNRHLIDAPLSLCHFGRDLRLETETLRPEMNPL